MRWKISVLLIAAMLCLTFTGVAAAGDIKCTWEPCGEKVNQCDKDPVYALTPGWDMRIMYTDVNSNNRFDNDDVLFIDAVPDYNEVEVGDVRLTDSCGTYDPNTKVEHGDTEVGYRLKELRGGQAVVGFVDINNDGVYDKYDPLYVDTDASSHVSVNDVRLTNRTDVGPYLNYTRVKIGDQDVGDDLCDPVSPYGTDLVTPIGDMLGYIDSDCSGTWTCPDKLYLQQIKDLWQFDSFVTIGDFRLYIPPEEVDHWKPCGTKVQQGDVDAVYALVIDPDMRIMYTDVNSNNRFDDDDGLYIDAVLDWVEPSEVEVGDVRLVDSCGNLNNTKVKHGDNDQGDTYKQLPGGQAVVGFVDINNDGVYDLCEPLYVDTDDSDDVSVHDVRLSARITTEGGEVNYTAYSRVGIDNWDIGDDLWDLVMGTDNPIVTDIWVLLGYIDSDCNCHWSCPDKLYLQQIVDGPADFFVTIGDFRLYIPQKAIDEEDWPECGTKVQQCNKDAVYTLTPACDMRIMYTDVNSNDRFDNEDVLFIDAVWDYDEVEVGDVRLTDSCGTYEPNTKVKHGEKEISQTLKELPGGQAVVGFVDINNDRVYDKHDPLYVDTDNSGDVSVNDVRLSARVGASSSRPTYLNYTRVDIGNWDLGDDLRDPVTYGPDPETPIAVMLGYIDSDCSRSWTCPDKLYLQQIVFWDFDGADEMVGVKTSLNDGWSPANWFVTIGDFRLYIPPEEVPNNPGNPGTFDPMVYDTRNPYGVIDRDEVFDAIGDYLFNGTITKDDVYAVIGKYLFP